MQKKISVAVFALIVLAVPLISFASPYRTFSDQENRVLASFPVFNLQEVTSKRFMSGFGDFVSDHIFARDNWMAMKAFFTTLTGARDNKGVYLGKDCLIENIAEPNPSVYKPNVEAISAFAKQTGKPVYLLLAPTAAEIERSRLPAFATTWDQNAFIGEVGHMLQGAQLIDTVDVLRAHADEYIYYRTDHHWTSLGAYYAYTQAAHSLGFKPLALSDYSVEHAGQDFDGTLYSKSGYRSITPDVIDFYHPAAGDGTVRLVIGSGAGAVTSDSIYFRNWLSAKDKYSAFFDGNQPLETIRTGATGGKKLLVIKDSYAHSLVPFLMSHYSEITMLDLRYLTDSVQHTVKLNEYDQVLFVYNIDTFNTDTSIQNVNLQ
ncbi:MAG: DHHW family protein [Clostridia bacterium]|nr:DHHW family protein [Clostridia bacterium]